MAMITRQKAAERLGVDPQTVSNYLKSGLIHHYTNDRMMYVDEDDLDRFIRTTFTEVKAMEDREAWVAARCERLEKEMAEAQAEHDQRRELMRASMDYYTFVRAGFGRDMMLAYLDYMLRQDVLTGRQHQLASMAVRGVSVDDAAQCMGLTRERVRQLLNRVLLRAARQFTHIDDMEAELYSLKERVAHQHAHIEKLNEQLAKANHLLDLKRQGQPMPEILTMEREARSINLLDYQGQNARVGAVLELLSCRARNLIKFGGIVSLYDLCQRTEHDIAKMRNCGRKSVREMMDMLADLAEVLGHPYALGCFTRQTGVMR